MGFKKKFTSSLKSSFSYFSPIPILYLVQPITFSFFFFFYQKSNSITFSKLFIYFLLLLSYLFIYLIHYPPRLNYTHMYIALFSRLLLHRDSSHREPLNRLENSPSVSWVLSSQLPHVCPSYTAMVLPDCGRRRARAKARFSSFFTATILSQHCWPSPACFPVTMAASGARRQSPATRRSSSAAWVGVFRG